MTRDHCFSLNSRHVGAGNSGNGRRLLWRQAQCRAALLLSLLLLCAQQRPVRAGWDSPCNCQYNVEASAEANCSVYGQLGSQVVPWNRASRICLKALGVSQRNMTLQDMLITCPYPNSTNVTEIGITNLFRANSYLSESMKSQLKAFFDYDWTTGTYVLKPLLEDPRTRVDVDCVATESFCWQVIVIYLMTDTNGIALTDSICRFIHETETENALAEQSTARRVLCDVDAGATGYAPCEPLFGQIQERKSNPNGTASGCSQFGTPAPPALIPDECPPEGEGESSGAGASVRRGVGRGTGGALLRTTAFAAAVSAASAVVAATM